MKKIVIILFLLSLVFLSFSGIKLQKYVDYSLNDKIIIQQDVVPINISRTGADSDSPLIGLDGNGAAYVIWVEHEARRYIFFATSKSGQWSNSERVVDINHSSEEAGFPAFAVSQSGICHFTFQDVREEFYDVYHASYNNGWSSLTSVSPAEGGSAYSACAVSPTNNFLYVTWMDGYISEWDLFFRYRNSSGGWGEWQRLPVGGGYMPDIEVDGNGTAHLVWFTRGGGSSTIWYSRNTNPTNSSGWTQPIVVKGSTQVEWSLPKIDCDNSGNAYIVWLDGTQGNQEIFLRKRNSNGSWGEEVNVSQTGGHSDEAAIAINRQNGNIFVAWTDNDTGNWDIFMNSFTGSWLGASNISNNGAASRMPGVAVDPQGKVHIVYADVEPGNWEIMYYGTTQLPPPVTKPFPPLDLGLDTQLDGSQTQKINTLTWKRNPENSKINVISYKVFRKQASQGNDQFQLIATVSSSTYQFEDAGLPLSVKYTYACKTVAQGNFESDLSESITEVNTFPPLNVALKTVVNSSLFQQEKINVISWSRNPLNDAIAVSSYRLYRKKYDQSDTQYQVIATLDASTFEYNDRKLSFSDKFSYILTTVDSSGFESSRSRTVTED